MTRPGREKTPEVLACLVIDDPLLRPRYGCLDFQELLEEMKEHRFFTEIAFIPWNYRRSEAKTVRLLADNPEYFGICVHGCNHTANEFGEEQYEKLSALSSTALWRMEQHKRLTGLPFDPVMVFPQGRFSSLSMLALKNAGYRSAFNTTLLATDAKEVASIEYARPATTIYHGLPLFMRRYPQDRQGFVQDMAAGRPIIIVEHHGAFKNGYRAITDFIDWINGLGNIKWRSLGQIADYFAGSTGDNVNPRGRSELKMGFSNEIKVAMRRFACELRDNYVEPISVLNKIYTILRNKAT